MKYYDPFQLNQSLFNDIGMSEDKLNLLNHWMYVHLWTQLRDAEYLAQLVFSHLVDIIDQYDDEFSPGLKEELVAKLKLIQQDESNHIDLSNYAVNFLGGPAFDKDRLKRQFESYKIPDSMLVILLVINLGEMGGTAMLGNIYKNTSSQEWKLRIKDHLRDESQHIKLQQDICNLMAAHLVKRPDLIQKIIFRPLFPWRFHSTLKMLRHIKEVTQINDPLVLFKLMDTNFFNDFFQTTIQLKYPLIKLLNIDMKFEEFERITKTNIGASLINLYKNL